MPNPIAIPSKYWENAIYRKNYKYVLKQYLYINQIALIR